MERLKSAWGQLVTVAPLLSVAFACLGGALWSSSQMGTLLLLLLALITSRPRWKWRISLFFIALFVAWRSDRLESPVMESLAQPRGEFVEGVLTLGRAVGQSARERYGVLVEESCERKVIVFQAERYQPGEVFRIKGEFFVPPRERNPGVFPKLDYWQRNGIYGGLVVREEEAIRVNWYSAPFRWSEKLRDGLQVGITRGLPESSMGRDVIQAMVLGKKPPRESEVSRAFRESGAMHVFAVSGLHVTLVGAIFWMILMHLPVPRRVGVFLVILAMVTYALVTGMRPPAIRATLMAICFLGAFFFRRRPSLFNALSLSLILAILWKPSQILDAGFQLSYGVLLAIGLGVGLALKFTGKIAELDPFFPRRLLTDGQRKVLAARTYFANLGASSLAAWLGSMPIMIWHFGVVTPIAVVTSLLLIPTTMVILGLAFFAAFAGLVTPRVGGFVNQVNSVVATGAFYTAKGFSKVPLGHWQSRRLTPGDWVVLDCENGGAASFLDVEGGAMIDVGGSRFYETQLRTILNRWNVEIETVFVTHPDGDHVGALPLILDRGGLGQAVLPMAQALSPSYREFVALAEDRGCRQIVARAGERFDLDDEVWVEILREGQSADRGVADNRIMVMKVHWKGWRVLVTGDLGINDELALIADGTDLSADVVLMGRHEWGVSGQFQFLKATGAKAVITSAARFPSYEMPSARWVKRVVSNGYQLFNQAETGAVIMDFEDDEMILRSFLKPQKEFVLQR